MLVADKLEVRHLLEALESLVESTRWAQRQQAFELVASTHSSAGKVFGFGIAEHRLVESAESVGRCSAANARCWERVWASPVQVE